ncbi:hypothetical protein L6164_033247 [Bauhinia variegata]|uniref:Uncharacterized protein n=1 Tax=Bauhinia variegata TaxID=167791 RepID=A0ACB9KRA8_BAUVA|nr:hypothetical protein L6164_033247 [Bauhinia variegata]
MQTLVHSWLLYVDNMLVAGPNKDRIKGLKTQLAREFEMKDLGPANKILGMQIHRERNNRKIWLSQNNYLKKILRRFNMQFGKFNVHYDLYKTRHCTCNRNGYVGLDYAGDLDKSKSTTGYVFALAGGAMVLEELRHEQEKISLFCHSKSALHLARNPAFHSKTKHIRVQYHFVREKVEEGTVDMQKIHTKDNLSDFLTKAANTDKFVWCQSSSGLAET